MILFVVVLFLSNLMKWPCNWKLRIWLIRHIFAFWESVSRVRPNLWIMIIWIEKFSLVVVFIFLSIFVYSSAPIIWLICASIRTTTSCWEVRKSPFDLVLLMLFFVLFPTIDVILMCWIFLVFKMIFFKTRFGLLRLFYIMIYPLLFSVWTIVFQFSN